jgi:PIN domain nuclease of toxin-antitoxin system
MNLLLDTHIWLWNDLQPEKITSLVARELADPSNQLWLSPVSIWELVLLQEKKKLQLRQDLGQWVRESLRDLDLKEAPFTWEASYELPFTMLPHRDPADRFLVATARAYDMTLVTSDEKLLSIADLKVLSNL